MCIKLDMQKAYDRIAWEFLDSILKNFDFSPRWRRWIKQCIGIVTLSILVNGEVNDYFKNSRGLRQGDPISPYLFILVAEALGRTITKQKGRGRI